MASNWKDIDEPWFEIEGFLKILVDKVNILDILNELGIGFSPSQTGDFSHKLKCPLPGHTVDGRKENTASFYVSESQSKFYCFGCNSQGTVIDFISLYSGKPFYESVKWLASYSGLTSDSIDISKIKLKEKVEPEKTIMFHVYNTGNLIRDYVEKTNGKEEYNKWCKWADKRFLKLDEFLDSLDNDDWEIAKKYYERVLQHLKSGIS